MPDPSPDPESLVPLTPAVYHILLALADGPRHGYAIMKEVEESSAERVLLSTGTLYAALRRLVEDGLIEESDTRPVAEEDDRRRRYYVLTRLGREVAGAETRRMADLVGAARAKRLVSGSLASGAEGTGS